jgi:hypothetical protein
MYHKTTQSPDYIAWIHAEPQIKASQSERIERLFTFSPTPVRDGVSMGVMRFSP